MAEERVIIIPEDQQVIVDDYVIEGITVNIDEDIKAVQWYGDHGEIQYYDKEPKSITSLYGFKGILNDFYKEKKKRQDEWLEFQKQQAKITWDKIRLERNTRLSFCDWTQLPDTDLTIEQKEQWAVYRQELRDITDKYENPEDVVWPAEPTN